MNTYFIAIVIIMVLELGLVLGKHGEERKGKHNFWIQLLASIYFIYFIYKAIQTGF